MTAAGKPANRVLILIACSLGALMQVLDTSMVSVALPHMMGSLSATQDQISWVLTFYIVAVAVMTPTCGFFMGRYGQRKPFIICVIGFVITSILCGLSTSITEIASLRLLQGLFGAGLVPMTQAIIFAYYPPEDRTAAMGVFMMCMMFGPIFGPTVGGYITEYYSWPWVFYVNLPVGLMAIIMVLLFVPETKGREIKFDGFGFITLGLSIACLQFMLDRGERADWFSSWEIILYAGVSATAFYVYIVHSLTSKNPFIHPRIFRHRNFTFGLILMFVLGIIALTMLALVPPYLQDLSGYPVMLIGLILAPRGFGTLISAFLVSRLMRHFEPRPIICVGLAFSAYAYWMFAQFTPDVSMFELVLAGVIQGFGMGLFFVPLSIVTFSDLTPEETPDGSALFALARNLGSSIGISIVVATLIRNTQRNTADIVQGVNPFNETLRHVPMPEQWDMSTQSGLAALAHEVNQQALSTAYSTDFLILTVCTALAIPLVYVCRNPNLKPAARSTPAE